eukprot:TRINITY_DN939_c0_g2_i2.p1 TRINITY_DN939_c0_g2~~TRINITY_DN939_c0_g2_i2.p1  ORF type:complete len:426 (+),score=63.21 TRINITY_DN939_c0_g2_i2:274-1551(+)
MGKIEDKLLNDSVMHETPNGIFSANLSTFVSNVNSNKGKRKHESYGKREMGEQSRRKGGLSDVCINSLPPEILSQIFSFLINEEYDDNRWNNVPKTLVLISRVCNYWYNCVGHLSYWSDFSLIVKPFNFSLNEQPNLVKFFNQPCFAEIIEIVLDGIDSSVLSVLPNLGSLKKTNLWKTILSKSKIQGNDLLEVDRTHFLRVDLSKVESLSDIKFIYLTTICFVRKPNQKVFHSLKHITGMTDLRILVLKGHWSDVDPTPLSTLRNLRYLDFSNSDFNPTPESLSPLRRLEALYFNPAHGGKVSEAMWKTVQILSKLQHLYLPFPSFTPNFDFSRLKPLPELETLHIVTTDLPFETIFEFMQPYLPTLTGLIFGAIGLTLENSLTVINSTPHLTGICFNGSSITYVDISALKEQFPRISFNISND